MFTKRALILAACVAILSGCGSGSSSSTSSQATTAATTTTTAVAKPAEPHGRLSPAEYTSFLQYAKFGDKLSKKPKPAKAMRLVREVCGTLSGAPATDLVLATRRACTRATRLFTALFAFRTEASGCAKASRAGDISCFGELYSRAARATHSVIASALEVNTALAQRGLKGECAKGIGSTSGKDLKTARAVGRDARLAGQALYARDVQRYSAANGAFVADFNKLGNGPHKSEVAQVRKCKHD